MEANLNILRPFFRDPEKSFFIREISRIIKINHTTVRLYLNKFVKEELLIINKEGIYPSYRLSTTKKLLNLKSYFNIENLRISGLVEFLEKELDYPVIVLFGSYSKAQDTKDSDVDIFILTEIKKDFNIEKYEKILERTIALHIFTKKGFENSKLRNKELINNICNGIVLSGQFRVL
jgi:predicted nucleotidyltransferase